MKTIAPVPFLLIVFTLARPPAFAGDEIPAGAEQQAPSVPKLVQRNNFSWSGGMGFIASPRPYKGTSAEVFAVPVVNVRYKKAFLQGIRGGFDLVQKDRLTASVFAQPRLRGLKPDDSPFLGGLRERKKSLDAGAEIIYRGRPVGFRIGAVSDVLGRSNGQEVSLLAVTGAPLGKLGLVLVGFGPRWLSESRVDYYYGVGEAEARAGRAAYRGQATWNLDLNVTAIVNVTSRLSLFALFNREQFGSGIENSPLVERSSAISLVTSLTYAF